MKGEERGEKVRSVARSPEATPGAAQLAHGPPASQRPTLPAGVGGAGLGAGAAPAAQEGNLLNRPGRAAPTPRITAPTSPPRDLGGHPQPRLDGSVLRASPHTLHGLKPGPTRDPRSDRLTFGATNLIRKGGKRQFCFEGPR